MSTENITEVVKEKYGAGGAAGRQRRGQRLLRLGALAALVCCDPITSNLYDAGQTGQLPEAAVLASLGCGNPTALARTEPGEDGARPGIGRRHRRAALGPARRAHRQGLRARHDRRDAGAGAREQAEGGRRRTSSS